VPKNQVPSVLTNADFAFTSVLLNFASFQDSFTEYVVPDYFAANNPCKNFAGVNADPEL